MNPMLAIVLVGTQVPPDMWEDRYQTIRPSPTDPYRTLVQTVQKMPADAAAQRLLLIKEIRDGKTLTEVYWLSRTLRLVAELRSLAQEAVTGGVGGSAAPLFAARPHL